MSLSPSFDRHFCAEKWCCGRESLRRKSLQMGKSLTHSVGGYLPNTLTEMWEPSRDFAFLRLPTSGTRCIVALSGWVGDNMILIDWLTGNVKGHYHRSWWYHLKDIFIHTTSIWRTGENAHWWNSIGTSIVLFITKSVVYNLYVYSLLDSGEESSNMTE